MSDMKRVREMLKEMEELGLRRVTIKHKDGSEITVEREGTFAGHAPPPYAPPSASAPKPAAGAEEGTFITAPMVGTFYESPGPNEPPFVKEGDRVTADQVVCIVEAMKVMNEVKAGVDGVIRKRLIENMHAVEFGTKLFSIE